MGAQTAVASSVLSTLKPASSELSSRVFSPISRIYAINHWVPNERLDLVDLGQRLSVEHSLTKPLDITSLTGVREVRCSPEGLSVVDMAVAAAEPLFNGGVTKAQVDLVIYFGVSKWHLEPATATEVQQRLGLEQALAFDVGSACLGFAEAMNVADSLIAAGRCRHVLLVGAEQGSLLRQRAMAAIGQGADAAQHTAALSLGDGAVALLLGPDEPGVTGMTLSAFSRVGLPAADQRTLHVVPNNAEPMRTQAQPLMGAAHASLQQAADLAMQYAGWQAESVDYYIAQQMSARSVLQGATALGLEADRAVISLSRYGNTLAIAVPLTLSLLQQRYPNRAHLQVLLAVFGAGQGAAAMTLHL